MSFSFSFTGEDIDGDIAVDGGNQHQQQQQQHGAASGDEVVTQAAEGREGSFTAFPVQGKPQLPPLRHDLDEMMSKLPSKIAYGILDVDLDGAGSIKLPRRELWDVRVQLAAEDEIEQQQQHDDLGLGKHDVRSGIYEGGFKSWESSVDLVKVLSQGGFSPTQALAKGPVRMIELGCGTSLPSLAVFQWAAAQKFPERFPISLTLADYNPSVLYLVTLPNFLLSWALQHRENNPLLQEALSPEDGELELSEDLKIAFQVFLKESKIALSFYSGGWSPEFVELLYQNREQAELPAASGDDNDSSGTTLVIGAETIYSPFALTAFTDTLLAILRREYGRDMGKPHRRATAMGIVAAKRLYFGVGGSLDDFVDRMITSGVVVQWLREETEGVRRGVVRCSLP